MENTGVKIKENNIYKPFHCKNEGFVLATFDPNTFDYLSKLRKIEGIKEVSMMDDKDGINIKLENNLELVGIRRKQGKIMEYEIVVKLNYKQLRNQ